LKLKPFSEPIFWKSWKLEHPEFQRQFDSVISYDGKILIVGGFVDNENKKAPSLILVDPETQKFQIIPSTGDAELCCWAGMSICYWKDSKIVVYGGADLSNDEMPVSDVAVITLKDLNSESTFFYRRIIFFTFHRSVCALGENSDSN